MEAPNRPKDGLLGPARQAGGEPPHPTPLGVVDGRRFRCRGGGGGAPLCGGPGWGLGVAVGAPELGGRGSGKGLS